MITDGVCLALRHVDMCQHMHCITLAHRRADPAVTQEHLQPIEPTPHLPNITLVAMVNVDAHPQLA